MTCKPVFILSLVAGTAIGSSVFAGSHMGQGMTGQDGGMMGMMHQMHDQMHGQGQTGMHGMRGMAQRQGQGPMHDRMQSAGGQGMGMQGHPHRGGYGKMGGGMHGAMRRMLDADGDGTVTPKEARAQLQAMLQRFDADANGSLSIEEYETLHSAMIREKMVDRFQHLDADGDGQITAEEMDAPAKMMSRMQQRQMMMGRGGATATDDADGASDDGASGQN